MAAKITVTFYNPAQLQPGGNPSGQPLVKQTTGISVDFAPERAMLAELTAALTAGDVPAAQAVAAVLGIKLRDYTQALKVNRELHRFVAGLEDGGIDVPGDGWTVTAS